MSLISDFQLISNSDFKGRVAIAILRAANDIRGESPTTPNHVERLQWAESISSYSDADAQAGRFLPNVIANPTISAAGTNATDNDLIFVVNGLVDQYALAQYIPE
jgi:hypothetical protein